MLILFKLVFAASILELATKMMQKRDFQKARVLLEKARESGENEAFVDYNLAYVYFQEGQVAKSVDTYKRLIANSPQFINAYHNLARVYFKVGDFKNAIAVTKKSVEADPLYTQSHLLLGDFYAQIEAYDLAEKAYDKAVEIDASKEDGYLALISLYEQLGDYEKALNFVAEARRNMGDESVRLAKEEAYLFSKNEDYLKAAAVYERLMAVEKNKDDLYDLYRSLTNIYIDAKMNLMAVGVLQEMVEAFPEKEEALDLLNTEYEKQGRLNEALNFYAKIFDKNKILSYKALRKLLYDAYNNKDREMMGRVLSVYDEKKLSDSLYKTVKSQFFEM